VLLVGIAISAALLGSSLGKFVQPEVHTIALIPPTQAASADNREAVTAAAEKEQTDQSEVQAAFEPNMATNVGPEQSNQSQGQAVSEPNVAANAEPERSNQSQGQTAAESAVAGEQGQSNQPQGQTAPLQTVGTERRQLQASGAVTDTPSGALQVYDDTQTWGTETQVDLFRDSYGGTVQSADGEKVIAPGTSNFYHFNVENNGDLSLNYQIALQVETEAVQEAEPVIPLEWRLLTGDGAAVTNWSGYSQEPEVIKEAELSAGKRDNYAIEWRWQFVQGRDEADTDLGNQAVQGPIGATATIYIYAEQRTDEDGPTGDQDDPPGPGTDDKPQPDDPDDPDDPNKPDDPDAPDDPNDPDNPNDPDKPDDPNDPNNPDDPSGNGDKPQPGDPGYTPGTGDEPQPGDPGYIPGTGDEPQPGDPGYTPGTDDGSQPGADGTPQTGDRAKPLLYAGLLAVAALGLLVVVVLPARRKKDEDRQHEQT